MIGIRPLLTAGLCLALVTPALAQDGAPVTTTADAPISSPDSSPRVGAAIRDAFLLLGIEHGVRLVAPPKTREELGGPFWRDYVRSVRMPKTWEDGDGWMVNYIGHPVHGAAAGMVWTAHDPAARDARFGLNAHYWATRWRPLVFSALYSVQFEIGPVSEASIGNVGLHPDTIGWVDYVVTPVAGMGIAAAEDALDRFFLEWFEGKVRNRVFRASMRMIFNPSRTMANAALRRAPWYREGRPVGH